MSGTDQDSPCADAPGAVATTLLTDGREVLLRQIHPNLCLDGKIAIDVTTGSAGLCRLGIYRWNGALLVDAGTVDTTSIAIVAATMASVALPDEIVWAAALFNATPSCCMGGSGNPQWLGSSNFQAGYRGRTVVQAYGTLPTTMVAPTGSLANVPAIALAFI